MFCRDGQPIKKEEMRWDTMVVTVAEHVAAKPGEPAHVEYRQVRADVETVLSMC
jgi:hypothetical protein